MGLYAKNDVSSKKIEHFGHKIGILVIFMKICDFTKFDPTNYISARHLNPVHPIWTKFGMNIKVDHRNKAAGEFSIFLEIQDGCRRSKIEFRQNLLKNRISAWQMEPVHQIWTKFGRIILPTPRNKLTEEFLTYPKIQDGRRG